jgi:hypothetical protein
MSKFSVFGIGLLLLSLAFAAGRPSRAGDKDDKDIKKKASVWMKTKLELSRHILEGLTDGDFKKIEGNAVALNLTHFLEALFTTKNPAYKQQVVLFTTANNEIVRQARAKNIYGATLAYNQLMVSCVQCHQIVRDAKKSPKE